MKLNMTRDLSGNNTFGLMFSDYKYNTTLAIGVEQTLTIPGKYKNWLAIFSYEPGAQVWVANGATAAIPGATMAAATSELNPVARYVTAADVLHFITGDTVVPMGVILYAIQ